MGTPIKLPPWRLDHPLAAFAAYATIIVELVDLIFNGLSEPYAIAASIIMNGSAVLLAGYGGPESPPPAFLCICLNTVFLLCDIASTMGPSPFHDTHVGCTYAMLCSIAHLTYSGGLLYKQIECRNDPVVDQQVEKKDDCVAEKQTEMEAGEAEDMIKFDRNISFQFGDRFRMEVKNLLPIVIGTALVTYRSPNSLNSDVGVIFGLLSGVMGVSLLFLIDATQVRFQSVDMDAAWQHLVAVLLFVGVFWYSLFSFYSSNPGTDWWRITFVIVWYVKIILLFERY